MRSTGALREVDMADSDPDDPKSDLPAREAPDALEGTPYKTLAQLGKGAMGSVYLAEKRGLGNEIVVKILHEDLVTDARFVDRMRVEAEAAARLSSKSPHLVQVIDTGTTRCGAPYVVMERLHGRTLRDELRKRGVLPVSEAIDVALQLLEGLAVVHDGGFLHRDIKLDNVWYANPVRGTRLTKLLDFGVAKVTRLDGPVKPLVAPTEAGVAVGTPRYMAPELVMGTGEIDERVDLYAAGMVLYYLLAGRGPFDHAKGLAAAFRAQLYEAPQPPSAHAPQAIPSALDDVVLRALAKRPEERFRSARAFAEALARVGVETDIEAPESVSAVTWSSTVPIETVPLPLRRIPSPPARASWLATEPLPEVFRASRRPPPPAPPPPTVANKTEVMSIATTPRPSSGPTRSVAPAVDRTRAQTVSGDVDQLRSSLRATRVFALTAAVVVLVLSALLVVLWMRHG
jgi:eukaryotic-like serine/threonine-protein kinase